MRLKPAKFRHDLLTLLDVLKQGEIKPLIAQRFPLEEAAARYEMLGEGEVLGSASRNNGPPPVGILNRREPWKRLETYVKNVRPFSFKRFLGSFCGLLLFCGARGRGTSCALGGRIPVLDQLPVHHSQHVEPGGGVFLALGCGIVVLFHER